MSQNADPNSGRISVEDRIRELSAADMDVVKMMQAMGRAIKLLAPEEGNTMTLEQRQSLFQQNVAEAFTRLANVDVVQRRSIMALAEEGIIEPSAGGSSAKQTRHPLLGSLDISMLNSQNDKVGKEVEADQWERVREILEGLAAAGSRMAG